MNEFTFTLASDLHVDHVHRTRLKDMKWGDYIIIAGDTSNGLGDGPKFINKMKNKGHRVFAIDGNHEHYSNIGQGRTSKQSEARFFEILNQEHVDEPAPGLTIFGTNGWYDPYDDEIFWKSYMNDHRFAGDIHGIALEEAMILSDALDTLEGKAIIITHTAPVPDTLTWRVSRDHACDWNRSNAFYQNIYMADVLKSHADKILVWCHGHTHSAQDITVHGVRVVCNPRGYPGENPNWSPKEITVSY